MLTLQIITGTISIACFIAFCWCGAVQHNWKHALFEEFLAPCFGGIGIGCLCLCTHAGEPNALLGALMAGLLGAAGTSIFAMFMSNGGRGPCCHDSTNQPIAGHRPGGSHKH